MARRTAFSSPAAAFLIASLLLPSSGAIAQAPQEEPTFFESVDVSVVNVEVFVTDRSDKRVQGLTQNDFEVFEDGKRIEISYFYAQDEPASGEPQVNVVEAPVEDVPQDQQLHLAIFVDNQNLSPANRNRVLPSVKSFLTTQLRPQDRVLLATYNGPGQVQVRQAPTRDPQTLVQAIDDIAKSSAGLGNKSDLRMLVGELQQSANPDSEDPRERDIAAMDAEASYSSIEMYAQQAYNQAKSTVAALEQFVNGLAGLPGRKAVLFISGGLSLRPSQAIYDAWEQKFGRVNREEGIANRLSTLDNDVTQDFEKLADRANANRVTFYSLGVSDVLSAGAASSRSATIWTANQEQAEKNTTSQSMALLSGPTGGIALFDATDPAMLLTRMREDMDSFYSLGYVPAHRRTGKNHKIEVKVKQRPDLRVRYRESFRDRTTQELMTDQTMSALLFGSDENPLEVALEFQDVVGEKVKKDERLVQLTVKLPMSKLVLLPQEQVHEGNVSVFLAVRDSQGRNSDITQVKIPVRIPNDRLMASLGQAAGYRTRLVMRPGEHTVAVGVRDELANVSSLVTQSYTPGQGTPIAGAASDAPADPPKKGTGL
ncbi:MAG TPA: VWA domain-containing protein [Thermoanaerobaculia bacterium]|nr:VWA domain-containing protein [Thermoanaerobaculia bacterium]